MGVRRKRISKKKRKQRGGAMFRRKPRLVDKIAEGASMFLSGPSPTFASLGAKLAGQAFKGIKDNVKYYRGRNLTSTDVLKVMGLMNHDFKKTLRHVKRR